MKGTVPILVLAFTITASFVPTQENTVQKLWIDSHAAVGNQYFTFNYIDLHIEIEIQKIKTICPPPHPPCYLRSNYTFRGQLFLTFNEMKLSPCDLYKKTQKRKNKK